MARLVMFSNGHPYSGQYRDNSRQTALEVEIQRAETDFPSGWVPTSVDFQEEASRHSPSPTRVVSIDEFIGTIQTFGPLPAGAQPRPQPRRRQPPPVLDAVYFFGHGSSNAICFSSGVWHHMDYFLGRVDDLSPHFSREGTIHLYVCGRGGAALHQALADHWRVKVRAPLTDLRWVLGIDHNVTPHTVTYRGLDRQNRNDTTLPNLPLYSPR
jgi:hypothetical protein